MQSLRSMTLALGLAAAADLSFMTVFERQVATSTDQGHIESSEASLLVPTLTATTSSAQATATSLDGVTGVDNNITTWAYHWGWSGCSSGQQSAVLQGLSEAHSVLGSRGVWDIDDNFDDHWNDYAAVEYLGSPWYATQNGRRSQIKDIFRNAYDYQQHWYSFYPTQVLCMGNDKGQCIREPSFIAVDNQYGTDGLTMTFCDRYFDLGPLQAIYDSASTSDRRWDLSAYENRARAWMTALFRVKYIIGLNPQRIKKPNSGVFHYMESASEAKWLAKGDLEYFDIEERFQRFKALNNPSNYAWYAMAEWVQGKFKNYLSKPQVPNDLNEAFTISANLTLTSTTDDSNTTCVVC